MAIDTQLCQRRNAFYQISAPYTGEVSVIYRTPEGDNWDGLLDGLGEMVEQIRNWFGQVQQLFPGGSFSFNIGVSLATLPQAPLLHEKLLRLAKLVDQLEESGAQVDWSFASQRHRVGKPKKREQPPKLPPPDYTAHTILSFAFTKPPEILEEEKP